MQPCAPLSFDAIIATPFGRLGICASAEAIAAIEILPADGPLRSPIHTIVHVACDQLSQYFADPRHVFSLPLVPGGTPHQQRVWRALCNIPAGQRKFYGDIAQSLGSSPRAVGQACGANPIPIVIPCHRVIGKQGLGGFMHQRDGFALTAKRWLLAHEASRGIFEEGKP